MTVAVVMLLAITAGWYSRPSAWSFLMTSSDIPAARSGRMLFGSFIATLSFITRLNDLLDGSYHFSLVRRKRANASCSFSAASFCASVSRSRT